MFLKDKKTRKNPLEDYSEYQAISNPIINFLELKKGKENVDHNMGIDVLLLTTSSSEEQGTEVSNLTPEEIIISELQIHSTEEQDSIEKATRGQHLNLQWHRQRKGRITASICKECLGRGNPSRIIKQIISVGDPRSKPKSHHMQYGVDNEDIAVSKFEQQLLDKNTHLELRKCGLYVSLTCGGLAASPDRVGEIETQEVVVEVKCLSASREFTPLEAARLKGHDSNFPLRVTNNRLMLKTNHKYYYQLQMQFTEKSTGYMVVFTNASTPVEYIKVWFDSELWEDTKQILLEYHATHILPALIS
jgi:hypothetical protein